MNAVNHAEFRLGSNNSSKNNNINTIINSAPVLLVVASRNEEIKKKLEEIIKYNSWYNVESKQWYHLDPKCAQEASLGDIGNSFINQVGKPGAFYVAKSQLEGFDRPAIISNVIKQVPEEYQDAAVKIGDKMVEHGKFMIASTAIELADIWYKRWRLAR